MEIEDWKNEKGIERERELIEVKWCRKVKPSIYKTDYH